MNHHEVQCDGAAERQGRILAYCEEAGRTLKLSSLETAVMRRAITDNPTQEHTLLRCPELLLDLGLTNAITDASDRRRYSRTGASRVSTLIEAARRLDDEIEFSPYADEPLSTSLSASNDRNPAVCYMMPLLRRVSRATVSALVSKLPVLPAAIEEVVTANRQGKATAMSLAEIARKDAVLAGSLIAETATVAYATYQPIRSIVQSIVHIGTTRACEVMMAAALRPLLVTDALEGLWRHSLEAARIAERISLSTNALPPGEAYLLGLVHDVGRLLLQLPPKEARDARDRLISRGTPRLVAELLTCGMSHAEAGAEVLRVWSFPHAFIEAVRWHHEPERSDSKITSLLYLVEFWSDASEDLPSNARVRAALDNLGIGAKELYDSLV